MIQLIATIIFIISVLGILIVLLRKIPILVGLPEVVEKPKAEVQTPGLKDKIKDALHIRIINKYFDKILVQKTLSCCKIWILKIEKRIDNLLQKLRKKSQEIKNQEEQKSLAEEESLPAVSDNKSLQNMSDNVDIQKLPGSQDLENPNGFKKE